MTFESPTATYNAKPVDLEEEQCRLSMELLLHPDPHVRLLAHMANRQLDMSFRISELARAFDELKAVVENKVESLAEEVERLSEEHAHAANGG